MTDAAAPVLLSIEDGIARVRFNRPRTFNAIDVEMANRFLDAVNLAAGTPEVRVVVLSGDGRAFMAGGDLQAFHADLAQAAKTSQLIIDPLHEAVRVLAASPAPVIASVHGAVAGAGFSLAMGCDITVASDDTRFIPAYAGIGTSPDGGGSWALPRLVGLRRAMEIALLGEPIDAATALHWGLVNRVVPAAELSGATDALARRLAQGPRLAFGETRRLLRAALDRSLEEQLDAERDAFGRCAATADFAEGIQAFFGKRTARFQGR
jgi:2-(1,2-epoxy-1,2-dihydrophenyl)acetyl-CoA isomerase